MILNFQNLIDIYSFNCSLLPLELGGFRSFTAGVNELHLFPLVPILSLLVKGQLLSFLSLFLGSIFVIRFDGF